VRMSRRENVTGVVATALVLLLLVTGLVSGRLTIEANHVTSSLQLRLNTLAE
jgi:ABC-type enterobactin transport system permease subunit